MRRGIGNPWRNKAPNPAIYAEALGKKFQAWRTQFSLEQGMDTIAQLPSIKEAEIKKWLDDAIVAAANDPPKRTALETMLMQREFNKMEGAIDGTFYKRFLTWLMGKGQEEDHIRTPWYRQAQALELEEVRELLEAFLWEIHLVENQLLKLVWKGPQTLNEYYLYFKYVLQHQQFVLETDPWFFLEWRQYSKDNVVMDPHGKPVARAGLDQANLGHEARPAETGQVIETMLNFFAELQSITSAEVEARRKEAEEHEKSRLQAKHKADAVAYFSDDDDADVEKKTADNSKLLEAQLATLKYLQALPEAIAAALANARPIQPEPEEEMTTAPSTPPSSRPSSPVTLKRTGQLRDPTSGRIGKKPADLPIANNPDARTEALGGDAMAFLANNYLDEEAAQWFRANYKAYSTNQIQKVSDLPAQELAGKKMDLAELKTRLGDPPQPNPV